VFDTDGVLTDTASVHAAAWKRLFDEYLRQRAARLGEPFRPFEEADYLRHVDGRPRYDGVAGFLAPRGIVLPWGDPGDPPDRETVCGLGNAKDRYFLAHLRDHGAAAFPTSVAFVRRLRARGLRTAAVSASRNMVAVLESAGLRGLFDVEVDGVEADRLGLAGKPDPALFLEAARRLQLAPAQAAVVEDALAGVEAGRRGRFRVVVGVDRGGQAGALAERGADLVVADLGQLILAPAVAPEVSGEPLAAGLRRLRPAGRAAPGGAVHPRQRLLRHPRSRARGGRRCRPLPRDLCRRGLQPPGQPGRRPRGGERGPGQRAQLAAPDDPVGRWAVAGPGGAGGARLPAGARPAPGRAHAPAPCPRPGRQGDRGDPAPFRLHGRPAPGRPGDHGGPRELVGIAGGPLGPGRAGDQRRRRALSRA
jgi:HAD superfamily hydrolase (TIGR01509 family)